MITTSKLFNNVYEYPKFTPLVNSTSITSSFSAFPNITEKARYEKTRTMKYVKDEKSTYEHTRV